MHRIEHRMFDSISEPAADAERGWSRVLAFPILLATIVGLLLRGRRDGRGGGRSLVPDVPHPRVLKDAHLR